MLLGTQTEAYREVFFTAWQTFKSNSPLSPMEKIIIDVIQAHPEYHLLFDHPEQYSAHDPKYSKDNPFLHLSMHIAVIEHIHYDRPFGFRLAYHQLHARYPNEHELQHQIMDIIQHMIWEAMQQNKPINEQELMRNIAKL
jgi:hypothetical protein